jgi:aspartate racemase
MKKLGLIGGLGPRATIHYYDQLAKAKAGEMMIVHADLPYVLSFVERGDRDGLASYFARLIERMARGGAEVAVLSAITPHICIRELERISPLPLVNVVTEIAAEIRARGLGRVALFSSRFVVQSKMYGMLEGIDVVVPEQLELIHDTYMAIVNGAGDEARQTFSAIAKTLDVDAVVLAGTDLALVFNPSNIDFPCVDGAEVHIRAILRELTASHK